MLYKGLSIDILNTHGHLFTEHKDPFEFEDNDSISHALIELPAPDADQSFSIRCNVLDAAYLTGPDGTRRFIEARYFFTKTTPRERSKSYSSVLSKAYVPKIVSSIRTGTDYTTREKIYGRLMFAPLQLGGSLSLPWLSGQG
jgi:hypothetical protein